MIGDHAFHGCASLDPAIPSGVVSIGDSAYNSTGITELVLPEGVTSIGRAAFYMCRSLTTVSIPASVTNISFEPFSGCVNLGTISVDASNPNYASADGILYNKAFTELICCPPQKTSVTIPDTVVSIPNVAFCECKNLTSIDLPDSLSSIGVTAFLNCDNLTSLNVGDGNAVFTSYDGVLYDKAGSMLVTCPPGKTSINFKPGVTGFAEYALSDCKKLMGITIPDSVTSLGMYALSGCSSLSQLTIPTGVTALNEGTLSFCTNLAVVTLPEGLTDIGDLAFYSCDSLTEITIPKSVTSLGERVFAECNEDLVLRCVPGSAADTYALQNGLGIVYMADPAWKTLTLPAALSRIGANAFVNVAADAVRIPASVNYIDDAAFGQTGIVIIAPEGSYAHSWSQSHGFIVVAE